MQDIARPKTMQIRTVGTVSTCWRKDMKWCHYNLICNNSQTWSTTIVKCFRNTASRMLSLPRSTCPWIKLNSSPTSTVSRWITPRRSIPGLTPQPRWHWKSLLCPSKRRRSSASTSTWTCFALQRADRRRSLARMPTSRCSWVHKLIRRIGTSITILSWRVDRWT